MQSRTQNSVRNILYGSINRLLAILIPFMFRTIIIYVLGEEYLGLNSLFSSILQVLNVADIGISTAISASMYKPIAENDTETVSALLSLYRKVYQWIGTIILVGGILVLPFLEYFINGQPPKGVNIYVLFMIYIGNTVASYWFFAYKIILVTAHQRMDMVEKVGTISKLSISILQVWVLLGFRSITLYVACNMLCVIIYNLGCAFIADKYYPQYVSKGCLGKEIKKSIYKNTMALAYHKVGNTISTSLDSIIISSFINLSAVAMYGNYNYICSAIGQFVALIFGGITASIGNSIVLETREKNYQDFRKISFMNMWIVGWCSICLFCMFQNFITLWMGAELVLDEITMIAIVCCFYVTNIRKVVLTYKDALGMWNKDRFKPLVGCIINLFFNILLVKHIGIFGVVMSTIISYIFVEQPWETRVLFRDYFQISMWTFYGEWIQMLLKTFLAAIATYMLCVLIPMSLLGLVIRGVLCIIIPNIILVLLNIKNQQFFWLLEFGQRIIDLKKNTKVK